METGKMKDTKDQQVETGWVPATPIKPILQQTVPIYAPGQENQPQMPTHGDGAVACSKFTGFMEKNKMSCIESVTEGRMKNIVGENSETCVKTVSGDTPAFGHMSFSELMFMQENAASVNLNATRSNSGLMNPFFSSLDSQIKFNRTGDTQGTSFVGCSQIASVEFDAVCTPLKMDDLQENNHDPELSKTPQPKQKRRKHRPKVIVESKPKPTRKPTVQLKENSTGKRKYVKRKGVNKTPTTPAEDTTSLIKELTPESTKKSCKRTLFDGFAGTENAIAQPAKDREVGDNINVSLPCGIVTSMKEASKSSRGMEKSEESQPVKRKYIRKKPSSHQECTPTAEGTSCEDPTQSNPPEAQPTEKTKRGRKKKTQAIVECSEPLIIGPNTRSRKSKKSREESTTSGQNSNACINQRSGMMNLAYSHDTSRQQGSNFYISLPVDTQVQNTSSKDNFIDIEPKEKQAKRRRYSRRNATNKVSYGHELSIEDTKASSIFSPESIFHETKSIINCSSFENDKNKRDGQTTARDEQDATILTSVAQLSPNDPVHPNTGDMNFIGVHYNDLARFTESTSATTNLNEAEMTFPQQDACRLPYASSSNSSEFNEFVSKLRRISESNFCPTGIQSCHEELNFTEKPGISDKQISEDALLVYKDSSTTKMCESLPKKKQTRKRSTISKTTDSSKNVIQHHICALGNYQLSLDKLSDVYDVDTMVKQFGKLKINTQENAIIRYKQKKLRQKRLLLGDGTIVPFQGQVVPIKKQYPRPRVNLDEETNRVWKLLMLDINSHGTDGKDEDKTKWWEEERNVFRGRADSFIAKMHRVQGDRRFSRWKGSVVDSVVGVFLTQNVSDHLSSSAFMALAARFPNKSQVNVGEPAEGTEGDAPLNSSVHDTMEHSGQKVTHLKVQECSKGKHGVRTGFDDMVASRTSMISQAGEFSNEQNLERIGSLSEGHSEVDDRNTSVNIDHQAENSTKVQEEADRERNDTTEKLTSGDLKNVCPTENDNQVPLKASIFPSHESVLSSENLKSTPCTDPQNRAEMSHVSHFSKVVAPAQTTGAHKSAASKETHETNSAKKDSKGKRKEKKDEFNWDSLRTAAQATAGKREKTWNTMDSLDWDAVRCADVSIISDVIKERGMNNRLAERIQLFLNRLVEDHGDIDLEWLRDVPPDKAKEFLLSIKGLGLKSVECVRLLTLHHLAFPVDTNVGRIAVRLGWVPLQPLPESLQLHLLELYPVLETIQKYLWPRLCKLDQKTLYELHYQMITFGKVFCTKSRPNCNACPMRGECRHFASAFASARLALPGPEQTSIVSTSGNNPTDQNQTNQNPTDQNPMDQNPEVNIAQLHLPLLENADQGAEILQAEVAKQLELISEKKICHPIIEEPATPEAECSQVPIHDIEDAFWLTSREIPSIDLDIEEFTLNLKNYVQGNMELQEAEMSKALVALTPEAANIPMPRLKNVSRLRTEHCVYELPDAHPLLEGWDAREKDDPGTYLLAIWTPGETENSVQPPERKCSYQESGELCNEKECLSCNSVRESDSQTVRGTILIPCRTAMRGSFPLNGTYFQVNEVFADHESSKNPISVPRSWIWNLNRRTVYFGTSVTSIFRGLTTPEIQQCFWRGYVCVRGFERATRAPRPLRARLHFPASKMAKATGRKRSTATKPGGAKTNPQQPEGAKTNPEQPEVVSASQNLQEGVKPKENPSLFMS